MDIDLSLGVKPLFVVLDGSLRAVSLPATGESEERGPMLFSPLPYPSWMTLLLCMAFPQAVGYSSLVTTVSIFKIPIPGPLWMQKAWIIKSMVWPTEDFLDRTSPCLVFIWRKLRKVMSGKVQFLHTHTHTQYELLNTTRFVTGLRTAKVISC